MGIAAATKTPELAIDESEAAMLARATANLMKEFDFVPDPKMQAIVGLVAAASIVYLPRAAVISAKRAQMRNVTPRRQVQPAHAPTSNTVERPEPAPVNDQLAEDVELLNSNPDAFIMH